MATIEVAAINLPGNGPLGVLPTLEDLGLGNSKNWRSSMVIAAITAAPMPANNSRSGIMAITAIAVAPRIPNNSHSGVPRFVEDLGLGNSKT